jgi:hypothetical protein
MVLVISTRKRLDDFVVATPLENQPPPVQRILPHEAVLFETISLHIDSTGSTNSVSAIVSNNIPNDQNFVRQL